MRGRGLKLDNQAEKVWDEEVAPHAGAWIETMLEQILTDIPDVSRPPCGGVD